ncbi:Hsp33 family molecular chaperone HslO [Gynuella sunshinyii]|uniref:33 kDa chaperonin n=1 Tax=Gynuella sunshinyii YC6258 TaxID=1445510 RepID=A0A0C5VWU9_9GAMM|nr:Hsp33 family molecular chaperone HslO [Gynuella sunshinyii]AJQ97743.1 disulfide bond chaperones of the HSP33 family [Gynuella sunshinyii YC6258]
MSNPDQSQRFLFDNSPVRGELVGLHKAYQEVLSKHNYPEPAQQLLGQFMAAAALLSSRLKLDGSLILQVSGNGQVRVLMAECNAAGELRAIAQYNDDFNDQGKILGSGQLTITFDPVKGNRYQGIVSLNDGENLADVLQQYFTQSEQLDTRIWLACDGQNASGLLLQRLPGNQHHDRDEDDDIWNRVTHLAGTIKTDELLNLNNDVILHRLFHEEQVRLFESEDLCFKCGCSRERSARALLHLGLDEARELIETLGHIDTDCQFCHQRYSFNADQVEAIFQEQRNSLN